LELSFKFLILTDVSLITSQKILLYFRDIDIVAIDLIDLWILNGFKKVLYTKVISIYCITIINKIDKSLKEMR
jgi:hypothetical protein